MQKALKAFLDAWRNIDDPPAFSDLSAKEKLLAFIFTLMLLGLPMLPSLLIHAAARPKYVIPAFFLSAAISTIFKSTLRKKNKLLVLIPALIFYIPAIIYLWLIFILISMGSVAIPLVVLLWCSLVVVFSKLDKTRRYFLIHLLGCIILFYVVCSHMFGPGRYLIAFLFILYLLLCEFVRRRKSVFAYFSPAAITCVTAATLIYCFAFLRYGAIYTDQAEEIVKQKSIRLIHAYDPDSDLMNIIGHNHMFAARLGKDILVGPHDGEENFLLIPDKKSISGSDIKLIDIGKRAGDMAAYLPDEPETALVGGVGKLYKLRYEPFEIEQTISAQSKVINFIRVDPESDFVFTSQDNAKNVIRFRLQDLQRVTFSKPIGPWAWFFDVAVDPMGNRFYVCPLSFRGSWILEGNVDTLAYTRRAPLKGAFCFLLEIDPIGRQLFISSYFTGELIVCDLNDLSIKARIPMGMSIRDLTFDSKRRRLYAVNYYAGKIIILDADRLSIINSLDVGPIARHANISRDGNELVVRTGAGIFSIDLGEIENLEMDPSIQVPNVLSITKPIIYYSARLLLPLFIGLNDAARQRSESRLEETVHLSSIALQELG